MREALRSDEVSAPPACGTSVRGAAPHHEEDLTGLDAQIEEEQRQRDLGPWQPHGGETARETEPVQEPEGECHHPWVANGEARLPRCERTISGPRKRMESAMAAVRGGSGARAYERGDGEREAMRHGEGRDGPRQHPAIFHDEAARR